MTLPSGMTATPLPEFDLSVMVDLDVRDDLRAGREPLTRIVAAADALPAGSILHVRTTFQPTPLFQLLSARGLAFNSQGFARDDWSSWFWRGSVTPPAAPVAAASTLTTADVWDLRGVPAPEPLRLLLERAESATDAFDVLLPGYSAMIPALLADLGWGASVVERADDGVRVHLARLDETQ